MLDSILPHTSIYRVLFFCKLPLNICVLVIPDSSKLILKPKSLKLDKVMSNFYELVLKKLGLFCVVDNASNMGSPSCIQYGFSTF